MKKRTNKIMHSFFIILIMLLVSCARQIKEQSFKNEGAEYNFAFVSDSSSFKDGIHQKLIEKYKSQANIDLLNIGKLKDIKANDYKVILIMDTCMAWSPSGDLNSFIKETQEKRKIVIFISANTASWRYSNSGIDAITSASKTENADPVYTEICRRIDGIISEK